MSKHHNRLALITIDVNDMQKGVLFWSGTLDAEVEGEVGDKFTKLKVPNSSVKIFLQHVPEKKTSKTRMHLDIEAEDTDKEVNRLIKLGAKKQKLVEDRGFRFWIMEDPFGNEFCVLQPEYPELLKKAKCWESGGHSRLCYLTIDINNFDEGVRFWSEALDAKLEAFSSTGNSDLVYRRLQVPGTDLRILLQLVPEQKTVKTRIHPDIEAKDTAAEVRRLVKLGARIVSPIPAKGYLFAVLQDPFSNEFCVLPKG